MAARKLETRYVEKPWGRDQLPSLFPDADGRKIGEVWFEGAQDEKLPILVKYIFTSEKLSVQVHPNDAQGRERGLPGGKTECWYILDAQPGATLGLGTHDRLSADQLRAAALDGSIERLMDWKPVQEGDFFLVPAGTIHAIGAGVTLVEVQQNVDVTYRLYDYGRPRKLDLDDGVAVSIARPYHENGDNLARADDADILDHGKAPFTLKLRSGTPGETLEIGDDSAPTWFIPLSGNGDVDSRQWSLGECWLIEGRTSVECTTDTRALIASP